MPLEDIPRFLKLTPEERKAAWDKHRLASPKLANVLPPEPPKLKIQAPPGARDADTDA